MGRSEETIFLGGGEAEKLLASIDWTQHPMGAVDQWPQSFRTALGICLSSRYPICILWGPQRIYLYNDAYAPIVGAKHPWALGNRYPEVWPEIWDSDIRPILEAVEATGEASWSDNILLVLQRHGFNEECYFLFSFAPIRNEAGAVGGVFTAITETTPQVVGERRLRTLRNLAARTADAKSIGEACATAAHVKSENLYDVPFALFYLLDQTARRATLVTAFGFPSHHPCATAEALLEDPSKDPWSFAMALKQGTPVVLTGLTDMPGGHWPEPSSRVLVLPIARPGQSAPYGFIVSGTSPRRPFDADYQSFLSLVANQVGSAVANALAYEEERKRAEALAELDRAKTLFFSNVSHEFRTPLTLMLSPLEDLLARDGTDTSGTHALLTVVQRNAQRLLKLVNTLLDFPGSKRAEQRRCMSPLTFQRTRPIWRVSFARRWKKPD